MRDTLSMGQQDATLEDKMITICYGTDMVPSALSWVNFAANSKDVAQVCKKISYGCWGASICSNGRKWLKNSLIYLLGFANYASRILDKLVVGKRDKQCKFRGQK